jgi:predicted O-methyltransferase YrrM
MNIEAWKILLEGVTPDGVDCHTVDEKYGHGNAIEIETAIFLYGLVRRINPQVIMETGTHFGFSTACFALALRDQWVDYPHHRKGHIYTVGVDQWQQRYDLWSRLELDDWITYTEIDSLTYNVPEKADILFLDADHGVEFVINEFNHYLPHLASQAHVLFHDTALDPREAEAVSHITSQLKQSKEWSFAHVGWRNYRGLDMFVMQRTSG